MKKLLLFSSLILSLQSYSQVLDCESIPFDSLSITFQSAFDYNTPITDASKIYVMEINGSYSVATNGHAADAAFEYGNNNPAVAYMTWSWNGLSTQRPDIDLYNPNHQYTYTFNGDGNAQNFGFWDSAYGDNTGQLTVKILECIDVSQIEEIKLGNKELVNVYDLMGNKVDIVQNKTLIYLYSDGSTKLIHQTKP